MRRLLPILLLSFLLVGCGDDDSIVRGDEPPESYPVADSPDQLVANFTQAWNERNAIEYDLLLHEDFTFCFDMEDIDIPAAAGGVWDRVRDLSSTQEMFSGQPGFDTEHQILYAPVQRIQLLLTPVTGAWSDQVPEERAGTLVREYSVEMQVDLTDGNGAAVCGLQRFYAAPVEADGGTATLYRLKFWEDIGKCSSSKRPNDKFSWGAVKALY